MRPQFMLLFLLLPKIAAAQSVDPSVAAANFQTSDANTDGVLSYEEFTTFVELGAAAGLGRLPQVSARGLHMRAFTRLDQNSDGRIAPEELQAMGG